MPSETQEPAESPKRRKVWWKRSRWIVFVGAIVGWVFGGVGLWLSWQTGRDARQSAERLQREALQTQERLKRAELETQERLKKFEVTYLEKRKNYAELVNASFRLMSVAGGIGPEQRREFHRNPYAHTLQVIAAQDRLGEAASSAKPFFDAGDRLWMSGLLFEAYAISNGLRCAAEAGDEQAHHAFDDRLGRFGQAVENCLYAKMFKDEEKGAVTPCTWTPPAPPPDTAPEQLRMALPSQAPPAPKPLPPPPGH
jgi:hypothetical protein